MSARYLWCLWWKNDKPSWNCRWQFPRRQWHWLPRSWWEKWIFWNRNDWDYLKMTVPTSSFEWLHTNMKPWLYFNSIFLVFPFYNTIFALLTHRLVIIIFKHTSLDQKLLLNMFVSRNRCDLIAWFDDSAEACSEIELQDLFLEEKNKGSLSLRKRQKDWRIGLHVERVLSTSWVLVKVVSRENNFCSQSLYPEKESKWDNESLTLID